MGNVWLKVGYSQSGDGKGAGLGRETGGGGQGPFWLSGAVVSKPVLQFPPHRGGLILISNFRCVLNAVLCLLGNLPASELLVPKALKAQMPADYPKDKTRHSTTAEV